jgi:hypothetical protein
LLFLHEVHQVVGAREDDFEAAFRDEWMPTLAKGDDARLLYFLHHAHGTGRAYNVVTITAVRDGAAWEDLARRIQAGDLRDWARDVDRLRHRVTGKQLLAVPWSPITEVDLATVPTSGHHPLTLFMEDTAWPHEGMLDDYLGAVQAQYAPYLAEARAGDRGLLELEAVFQAAWGSSARREVVLWQKVRDARAITGLVSMEIPAEHRAPGTWMHDALRVRDDWESKLLRTSAWSPLY